LVVRGRRGLRFAPSGAALGLVGDLWRDAWREQPGCGRQQSAAAEHSSSRAWHSSSRAQQYLSVTGRRDVVLVFFF
jgi:hypothetical protein